MLGCDNEKTKAGVTAPGASEGFGSIFILISFVLCFERGSYIVRLVFVGYLSLPSKCQDYRSVQPQRIHGAGDGISLVRTHRATCLTLSTNWVV